MMQKNDQMVLELEISELWHAVLTGAKWKEGGKSMIIVECHFGE